MGSWDNIALTKAQAKDENVINAKNSTAIESICQCQRLAATQIHRLVWSGVV